MRKRGRFEQQKPKKRRSAGKIILIIVAVLLVVVITAVIFGISYYNSILDKIPRAEHVANSVSQEEIDAILNYNPDAPEHAAAPQETAEKVTEMTTEPTTEPTTIPTTVPVQTAEDIINVMVVGQAARAGEEYHMADTMILVTVNTYTKTMTLTSFLRDAYVKLPDYKDLSGRQHHCGNQRLNVCYHLGYTFGGTADAMLMLNQCVRENFGVDVDFDIEVGFDGVVEIVNYLGGIEIDLTQAEADYLNADDNYVLYEVQAGPEVLDGMAALSYARMRKAEGDSDSDIKRTNRQRVVLEKLLEKVRGLDVAALQRLMDDFLPYFVTNMTDEDITKCILEVFPIISELKIETGTCPVEKSYGGEIIQIGGYDASVLKFDAGKNQRLMKALTEGQ